MATDLLPQIQMIVRELANLQQGDRSVADGPRQCGTSRSKVNFTVLDFESCQFGPRELGGGNDVCPDQLLQGNLLGLKPAGSSDDTFKLQGALRPRLNSPVNFQPAAMSFDTTVTQTCSSQFGRPPRDVCFKVYSGKSWSS
jgi:hypothetical protein